MIFEVNDCGGRASRASKRKIKEMLDWVVRWEVRRKKGLYRGEGGVREGGFRRFFAEWIWDFG